LILFFIWFNIINILPTIVCLYILDKYINVMLFCIIVTQSVTKKSIIVTQKTPTDEIQMALPRTIIA